MIILVTDKVTVLPVKETLVLHWNFQKPEDNLISIPEYLDQNSNIIKDLFLDYIHELGHKKIDNNSLISKLKISKKFSFWWLNLISEKSPFKSKNILNALKILCIIKIINEKKPKKINIDISNKYVKRDLIKNFKQSSFKYTNIVYDLTFIDFNFFLYLIKAFRYYILYFSQRIRFSLIKKKAFYRGDKIINIFTYFTHFDSKSLKKNTFKQNPWGLLPDLLLSNGYKINWVHLFLSTKEVPNSKKAISLLDIFNNEKNNSHQVLDSYIDLKIILRTLVLYFKVILKSFNSKKHFNVTMDNSKKLSLYNTLKSDYYQSIYGSYGIQNAIKFLLFEKLFERHLFTDKILYLYENQNWENLLIYFNNKINKIKKTIAYQHATVPFWHLYYFTSLKTLNDRTSLAMPLPDFIALNSKNNLDSFIEQGYDPIKLVEVEALRYIKEENLNFKIKKKSDKVISILIVGEYSKTSMNSFSSVLKNVFECLDHNNYEIFYKPHPAFNFDLNINININLINENLNDILSNFDLMICTNSTSACVDALINNTKVIIYRDHNFLNLSPLLNNSSKNLFFSNENELEILLNNYKNEKYIVKNPFNIDNKLTKWKKLLNIN